MTSVFWWLKGSSGRGEVQCNGVLRLAVLAQNDELNITHPCAMKPCHEWGTRQQQIPPAALRNNKSKAEEGTEVGAGVGRGVGGDLFGGPGGDDMAAGVAAFGTEVDDPIGGLDDVEVVLDDEQ